MDNDQSKMNRRQTILMLVCMLFYFAGMLMMLLGRMQIVTFGMTAWLIPMAIANVLLGVLLRDTKSKLAIPAFAFAAIFLIILVVSLFV